MKFGFTASLNPRLLLYTELAVPSDREVEIKFLIDDMDAVTGRLKDAGFSVITPRTHEFNTLYDQPGAKLRRRGALLRLRKFGEKWTLTYKDKSGPSGGRHKSRREIETLIENGEAAARIFESLGFQPSFRYEKFRSEWADSTGHVVLDETPIGAYGEIEGPPKWIDATARLLLIAPSQYITLSYTELFAAWKRKTKSKATEMTFAAVGSCL
ncbi:MAG TPA: class IV adenylate cyclase [Candidatus Angelobacter sp.]|nr:class IV adenylate cyclase [Candidatus Angelobacter sp.]